MTDTFTRKEFLESLFPPSRKAPGGFIVVKEVDRSGLKTSTRYFPNTDTLSREQYPEDHHVFFGPCLREKMKPGKEHIRYLTCIWATIDVGPDGYSGKERHFASDRQVEVAIRDFELIPSIRVKSGRGIHLYWLLREPRQITDPVRVEATLRRIHDYFQCRSDVGIDCMLRLPGTSNPKYTGHNARCHLDHLEPGTRYDLEDFEKLDLRIIIPSKRAPVPPKLPPLPPSRVRIIREPEEIPTVHVQSLGTAVPSQDDSVSSPSLESMDDESLRRLGNHVVEAFSEQVLDRLADRIVERLLVKLGRSVPGRENES